ncbi:MAG: hypothetical protein JWM69_452 [Candidatus Binatus sp.]|nr:hypothetical protein [Candidatus Binatus sp.]
MGNVVRSGLAPGSILNGALPHILGRGTLTLARIFVFLLMERAGLCPAGGAWREPRI